MGEGRLTFFLLCIFVAVYFRLQDEWLTRCDRKIGKPGRHGLLGLRLFPEILCERGGSVVRFVGRPNGIFPAGQQAAFAWRQLGGEKPDGAKLVRAREFVESRKQLGEFHADSVSDFGMVELRFAG